LFFFFFPPPPTNKWPRQKKFCGFPGGGGGGGGGWGITLDVNVTHGKMEASMNAVHHSLDFCKCRLYQTQREKLLLI